MYNMCIYIYIYIYHTHMHTPPHLLGTTVPHEVARKLYNQLEVAHSVLSTSSEGFKKQSNDGMRWCSELLKLNFSAAKQGRMKTRDRQNL